MNRDRIKKLGTHSPNGNDAYDILGTVFDWIEEKEAQAPDLTNELLGRLRDFGYCACSTEYGCVVCGGTRNAFENNEIPEELLTHTGGTMDKVLQALMDSGLTQEQATNAVNSMQNAGILFREMR